MNKILIETSWQLGDCVVWSPLLEGLIKNNPNMKIDIIVKENSMDMFKYYPYINKIYPHRKYKNKLLRYIYIIGFALKNRKKYDLLITFESGCNTYHKIFLKILHASKMISIEKIKRLKYIDMYFKTKDELYNILNIKENIYKIYLGKYEKYAEEFFKKEKINVIYNYLGSTKNRVLTYEENIKILKKIYEIGGDDTMIYVSSTPAEYENTKELVQKINLENIKILPKTRTIFEISSYIKYSDIVISVDTSLVHIASAYNKLILGFYGKRLNIEELNKPNSEIFYIVKSSLEEKIGDLDIKKIEEYFLKLKNNLNLIKKI